MLLSENRSICRKSSSPFCHFPAIAKNPSIFQPDGSDFRCDQPKCQRAAPGLGAIRSAVNAPASRSRLAFEWERPAARCYERRSTRLKGLQRELALPSRVTSLRAQAKQSRIKDLDRFVLGESALQDGLRGLPSHVAEWPGNRAISINMTYILKCHTKPATVGGLDEAALTGVPARQPTCRFRYRRQ